MKRRLLSPLKKNNESIEEEYLIEIPDELRGYADNLRLLNDIPLTYLLTDVADLPSESIRFGIVDINWIDAYLDGAFSIGRICGEEGKKDKAFLKKIWDKKKYLDTPRMKKMHPNHSIKQRLMLCPIKESPIEDFSEISVVLIRSKLIEKKGIHFSGYKYINNNRQQLLPLRIDRISDDIMICMFSGILDDFFIEEPMTGMQFGCQYDGGDQKIDLRSALDDENLGKSLGTLSIKDYVNASGKINAKKLSDFIAKKLEKNIDKMTPSHFAFEIISVAHRAIFSTRDINNKRG